MMLGIAIRRSHLVSVNWDLGKVGMRILMLGSLLITALLAFCGLYAVARFVELVWMR